MHLVGVLLPMMTLFNLVCVEGINVYAYYTYREDWKPVLTINSIIYGLQFLFLEPNPDDPLNKGWCNYYDNTIHV